MIQVSIIVPCYNVEKYLVRCLESIAGQDFNNYEIICVNDGSTDGTGRILASFKDRLDDRMRIITHQYSLGVGPARNAGIDNSSGRYIASVDSDDWIDPGMVRHLFTAAEATGAKIYNIGYEEVNENGEPLGANEYEEHLHVNTIETNPLSLCWPAFRNKLYQAKFLRESLVRFPTNSMSAEDLATIPRLVREALGNKPMQSVTAHQLFALDYLSLDRA